MSIKAHVEGDSTIFSKLKMHVPTYPNCHSSFIIHNSPRLKTTTLMATSRGICQSTVFHSNENKGIPTRCNNTADSKENNFLCNSLCTGSTQAKVMLGVRSHDKGHPGRAPGTGLPDTTNILFLDLGAGDPSVFAL